MVLRFFDISLSILAILTFSCVLLPIMLLLRFTGEGKIFFLQERIGQFGKPFFIIKFATMLEDSPNIATGTITIENDPRVLPVGRVLRKTKINELAQLLNVIKGEMSLIGPRPLSRDGYAAYDPIKAKKIYNSKPGLSGIGSIIFRDEEKILSTHDDAKCIYENDIAPHKECVELWFAENKSIKLYFILLILTVIIIFYPNYKMVHRLLPTLPKPKGKLQILLNVH